MPISPISTTDMTVQIATPPITAAKIACYFIYLANQTGSFINNSKLQKLVYYAQAWHLALYDTPLFEEDFEAWSPGSVIPGLFEEYKKFGWKPILKEVDRPDFPQKLDNFLEEIARDYLICDNFELEVMVHRESPWLEARKGLRMDEHGDTIISKESIKKYYRNRLAQDT